MAHGAVADLQHLVRVQRNQLVHLRPQAICVREALQQAKGETNKQGQSPRTCDAATVQTFGSEVSRTEACTLTTPAAAIGNSRLHR